MMLGEEGVSFGVEGRGGGQRWVFCLGNRSTRLGHGVETEGCLGRYVQDAAAGELGGVFGRVGHLGR